MNREEEMGPVALVFLIREWSQSVSGRVADGPGLSDRAAVRRSSGACNGAGHGREAVVLGR